MFAPIAVFAYNRPMHLELALRAIEANHESRESEVYIFVDGPKLGKENISRFQECLEVANLEYNFLSKLVTQRESNLGLAQSIRAGLDFVFEQHDSVVIVEDDIILAPNALSFLNQGLNKYVNDQSVSSINSYQYPLASGLHGCVALRGADCWGWATWRDRWVSTSFKPESLLADLQLKGLNHHFDLDGNMDYSRMLKLQSDGQIDSWAICWHASMFLQGRYCIYPPGSLALNIGSDGSGTHSGAKDIFHTELSDDSEWDFPDVVTESIEFRRLLMDFYAREKPNYSFIRKLLKKSHRIISRMFK